MLLYCCYYKTTAKEALLPTCYSRCTIAGNTASYVPLQEYCYIKNGYTSTVAHILRRECYYAGFVSRLLLQKVLLQQSCYMITCWQYHHT